MPGEDSTLPAPGPQESIQATVARGLRPGAQLGGYRIDRELGRGAMGVVFQAHDLAGERDVALKILLRRDPSRRARERFKREGELAAALRHPGIVRVHAMGEADGQLYIAQELLPDCRSLGEALDDPTASMDERVAWIRDAARGLGQAHSQGVIHRDIKPANILIGTDGRVAVSDFGLATTLDLERLTETGTLVGTPLYMAPELIGGERDRIGPATDVWSLGVILYQALTDQVPFEAASLLELLAAVMGTEPVSPRQRDPQVPPDLEAVCLQALSRRPEERYADGGAFAEDLERALAGEAVHASSASRLRRGLASGRRLLLVGLLLLGSAALALAVRSAAPRPATLSPETQGDPMERARAQLEAGAPQAAWESLASLGQVPGDELPLLRVRCHLALGHLAAASAALEELVARSPGDRNLLACQVRLLLHQQEVAEARARLLAARAQAPLEGELARLASFARLLDQHQDPRPALRADVALHAAAARWLLREGLREVGLHERRRKVRTKQATQSLRRALSLGLGSADSARAERGLRLLASTPSSAKGAERAKLQSALGSALIGIKSRTPNPDAFREVLRCVRADPDLLTSAIGSLRTAGEREWVHAFVEEELANSQGAEDLEGRLFRGFLIAFAAEYWLFTNDHPWIAAGLSDLDTFLQAQPEEPLPWLLHGFLAVRAGALARAERDLHYAGRAGPSCSVVPFYEALLAGARARPREELLSRFREAYRLGWHRLVSARIFRQYPEVASYERDADFAMGLEALHAKFDSPFGE